MSKTFKCEHTSWILPSWPSHCRVELETRKHHHLKGNEIPAGYSHMNAHYAGGVNNYLNSNHVKYLAQLCSAADFFCVLDNFRHKFANLVEQDGNTKRLLRCKMHPVL